MTQAPLDYKPVDYKPAFLPIELCQGRRQREQLWHAGYRPSACTISSVIFFASPNSIMVFGRKNNSLSTPA